MAKAFLKFTFPSNPDYLIVRWVEHANPLAEVGRQSYAAPHPERSLTVDPLNPVMHQFQFYQSSDGVALGTLLLTMEIDCSIQESEFNIYEYEVDRGSGGVNPTWNDPAQGGVTVSDERLIGQDKIYIEQRAVGKLKSTEVTIDNVAGTWTLIGGALFSSGDTYWAIVEKKITITTGGAASGVYNEVTEMTASAALISTMYNKIIAANATGNEIILSVPALSGIPNMKFKLTNHAGSVKYVKIALSITNTIALLQSNKSNIWIGAGEDIEIIVYNGVAYVAHDGTNYKRLGQIELNYRAEKGRLTCDGTQYNIADHPRIYYDFIANLSAGQVKTEAEWATSQVVTLWTGTTKTVYPNKGFFAVDLVAGKFRLPDLRNMYVRGLKLSGVDTERITDIAGGFQYEMIRSHSHGYDIAPNASNAGTNIYGRGGDSGDGSTHLLGGAETRTDNIGLIPQIVV